MAYPNATEVMTNLTNYVNQINTDLQRQSVLKSRFVDQISHMPGIKNAEVINAIRSQLQLTAPTCGTILAATGSVTPFQNTLTVCECAIQEVLCVPDFETKYWGMLSKEGSYNEFPPESFVEVYLADKIDKTQEQIEFSLVCGSPNGTFSSTTSTLCNGLIYTLTSTSATMSVVSPGVTNSVTITTAVSIVDQFYAAVPSAIRMEKDLILWMSYADFETYRVNLRNLNFYHFNSLESEGGLEFEMYHPGTRLLISACHGLDAITNGNHYWFLTTAKNLFFGYDSLNDPKNFQFWFSQDTFSAMFRSLYKIGINAAYYEYIVFNGIAW